MTYLYDRNKRIKKYKFIIIGFILLILSFYFWSPIRKFIYPVIDPAVHGAYVVQNGSTSYFKNFFSYFYLRNYFVNRISSLEGNIERLENENASLTESLKEFQDKKEFDLADTSKVIILYPIIRDYSGIYSSAVLSKGFSDGVEAGALVYLRGMEPVGTITEVHDKTSVMTPFSASNIKTDAVIKGKDLNLSLTGAGGGSFVAELPKNVDISVGDEVFYGEDQKMKLGTVVTVKNDLESVSEVIFIRGEYNPMKANIFYITK